MTIPMPHAFLADTMGTCMVVTTGVLVLAKSRLSQNMSNYKLGYLFLVRQALRKVSSLFH